MFYLILAFIAGFAIPFIARRLGKILPATTGAILFQLPHRPRFPKIHNPLRHRLFNEKWKKLLIHAVEMGFLMAVLCFIGTYYLPDNFHIYSILFIWILLCAAETDNRYFILPDCLTIPLLMTGFLFALQTNALSPFQSIAGSFFAYIITILSVFLLSFKQQTLFGGGDSKMAIALGAWLGVHGLNYTILISFLLFVLHAFLIKKRVGFGH